MGSYKKKHAGAKRAERTYPVCLRGDLNGDWQAANRELERAREKARSSDSKEGTDLGDLVDRVRAIEAQMLEHTEEWRLRALPKYKFRALVAAHPPRLGEDEMPVDSDRMGVNRDTFFPELIRESLVSPDLDDEDFLWLFGHSDDEREQLVADGRGDEIEDGILNDRQIGDLEDVAWFLNRDEVRVPFSHAASLATRDIDSE